MSRWPAGYRPAHGTWNRYKWELRHDGKACPECRKAWSDYVTDRRRAKKNEAENG